MPFERRHVPIGSFFNKLREAKLSLNDELMGTIPPIYF